MLQAARDKEFDAVAVELDKKRGGGTVQLVDPAVRASCEGRPHSGRPCGSAWSRPTWPVARSGSRWPEDRSTLRPTGALRSPGRADGRPQLPEPHRPVSPISIFLPG